jgi:5-methylcytosine-specific restriction endonuclease McrA
MLRKAKRIKVGKQTYRPVMKRVLERDGWRCQKCGSLENLQVHHKIKRSQQGNDALANLVTFCAHWHMAEHGQPSYEISAAEIMEKTVQRGRRFHGSCL